MRAMRLVAVAALVVAAGTLGACASVGLHSASDGPTRAPSAPPTPSAPPGAVAPPTPSRSASPHASPPRVTPAPKPAVPGKSACTASHVAVKQVPGGEGAAGTIAVTIRVTNIGSEACTLRGYPSFTLAGDGRTLSADVAHGDLGGAFAAPVTTVTLAPGANGGFLVAYGDVPRNGATSCRQATRLALALPGGTATGTGMIMLCGGRLTVSPYLPASQLND